MSGGVGGGGGAGAVEREGRKPQGSHASMVSIFTENVCFVGKLVRLKLTSDIDLIVEMLLIFYNCVICYKKYRSKMFCCRFASNFMV